MKIQPFIEKINNSGEYKGFKKKYSDSFLAAGFFVLDLESGNNINQMDYYIPSQKKFAAFTLGKEGVKMQLIEALIDKAPEKLDLKSKINLESLPGILEDEMKNRNITDNIRKIIAVLQNVNGKKIWNIHSVLSGMDILKAHIEDSSETILKMEKTSFVDIMKKIPLDQMKNIPGQNIMPKGQLSQQNQEENVEEMDEENAFEEIKKLDELEGKIEKEKSRLKKSIIEKEKNTTKVNSKESLKAKPLAKKS